MINELRVFDRWNVNDQLLIPLSTLLELLMAVCPKKLCGPWKIFKGSSGYGEKICEIEDMLEDKDYIFVESDDFLPLLTDGTQYFNNARILVNDGDIEFGVHDSTFLFVRGNPKLLRKLKKELRNANIVRS